MKRTTTLIAGLLVMLTTVTAQSSNGPTMGWSSWNTFALNISESIIKGQADAIVNKGLLGVGFDHINIDDGYFGGRDSETGQLKIHPSRFPHGLKPVVEYIHSKGLKAGIYSDAGMNTCGSYHGGDKDGEGVGLYQHDQQDADYFFKELGFDFIKVDFCGGDPIHNKDRLDLDEQQRYTAIAKAIKNTGRTDVRMNACRWAYPGTWIDGAAFSWRTTGDINASWESVRDILKENLYLSAYCSEGHYNDMDMLEVGRTLTSEEDKTHFGMWCIMNSPLLIGCNLTNINTTTLNLLKNKELIALNQDTLYQQAYLVGLVNGCYILVKDIETRQGNKRAFAVYNPNDGTKTVTVDLTSLELGGKVRLRDVFAKRDLGEFEKEYKISLTKHSTRIYVAECDYRVERTRYEAETGYISDYQEIKNNQAEKTGIYETSDLCSCGYKAGWLGQSEKNDLLWRDVYSHEGGEYKLTIGFISGESRNTTVSVNGKKITTLSLHSGGWQTVGKRVVTVNLEKGFNTVRLSNASGWMPDIDYIDLVPTNPSSVGRVTVQQQSSQREYDMQGRKVNPKTAHGIVISNGSKYVRH